MENQAATGMTGLAHAVRSRFQIRLRGVMLGIAALALVLCACRALVVDEWSSNVWQASVGRVVLSWRWTPGLQITNFRLYDGSNPGRALGVMIMAGGAHGFIAF